MDKIISVIKAHYDEITKALVDCYRYILENRGESQIQLYMWEDGKLECLEEPQGDLSNYLPSESESRKLYYLHTVESPFFDPWDFVDHPRPDDEKKREAERSEIIDSLVSEYDSDIDLIMKDIIKSVKESIEMYEE